MLQDSDSFQSFYAAIWVGVMIPENDEIPAEFHNTLIFGDFTRGFIRTHNSQLGSNSTHLGHLTGVVDFEVYNDMVYALATGVQTAKDAQNPGVWRMVFN